MKKAFDRVSFSAIFIALCAQGRCEELIALLVKLYAKQRGSIAGGKFFDIRRGVKQGDVIISIIFNATLELVFQRWKSKLETHGWLFESNCVRLTNIRYSDDK